MTAALGFAALFFAAMSWRLVGYLEESQNELRRTKKLLERSRAVNASYDRALRSGNDLIEFQKQEIAQLQHSHEVQEVSWLN